MSCKEVKLYRVVADYRRNNPNKPKYFVCARSKSEAKKRFKSKVTWLDVYEVELCNDSEIEWVMAEPRMRLFM